MSKTIIHLNASSLKSEFACGRRWYLTVVEGWKSKLTYNDTEYGSAFHRFVSTWRQTGDEWEGISAAMAYFAKAAKTYTIRDQKDYLTREHLHATCQDYALRYANDEFQTLRLGDKALVEQKFCIPYFTDAHVEILLEGTIDDVCKNPRGCYAIRDYKTTAVRDVNGYLKGYELSTQLMFYYKAVKWYATQYPDSILADFAGTNFACFIDGVFHRGASKPSEFIRSDMMFYDTAKIAEFETLLQRACLKISDMVKANIRPMREGMINGYCFGHFKCPYFLACAATDARTEQYLLEHMFKQVPYEPLKIGVDTNE